MKIRSPLPLSILAATLCVLAVDATAKQVIKIASIAPEGSAWMTMFDKVRSEVREATHGEIDFKVYPGGVLGEEKDVFFKIKVGQVDGAAFMGPGIGRICTDAQALMMPLVFTDYDEVDAVFPKMRDYLDARCRENGFEALGWTEIGFSYLYSNVPIKNMDDLRAAKPWAAAGDEILAALFDAGDISAIPVQFQDVLPALQTGLIDTIYAPPLAAVALQWFSRVKYRNDLRLIYSFGGFFIAERSWQKVPENYRRVIADICERRARELTLEVRKSNDDALSVMTKQGIETLHPTADDVAEFKDVSLRAGEAIKGRIFSAETYDLLNQHLREYRQMQKAP